MTMTLVSTVTVGSGGAASIEWTGIPQTGTDLLVVLSGRETFAAVDAAPVLRFNSSTTGYTMKRLTGSGSAVVTGSGNRIELWGFPGSSATSNTFSNQTIYIPNYTAAINKSVSIDGVGENNATAAYQNILAGIWANTAAITSLSIVADWNTFAQYSTASLYLIEKGSGGATVS